MKGKINLKKRKTSKKKRVFKVVPEGEEGEGEAGGGGGERDRTVSATFNIVFRITHNREAVERFEELFQKLNAIDLKKKKKRTEPFNFLWERVKEICYQN